MRFFTSTVAAALLLLATSVNAQSPALAAPQVTVGAELKSITFDWDPVPGATHYWLLARWTKNVHFRRFGDRIPATVTNARVEVAVHQVFWDEARFVVQACDATHCQNSRFIGVQDQMLDTIGYLKASNADAGDRFGRTVALSLDGSTLAVTAERESSNATGANGNQSDNSSPNSGAVYVYRHRGATWRQEGYLKAGTNQPDQSFGFSFPIGRYQAISLSEDGSLLAAGSPQEDVNFVQDVGTVYLFHRGTNNAWSLLATLHSPSPEARDFFGVSVDLSADGNTLKVGSLKPADGEGNPAGRTHIFVRTSSGWQHQATIAPFYPEDFCPGTRMSSDAGTLVQYCVSQLTATARTVTFKRSGAVWVHVSDLVMNRVMSQQPQLNHDARSLAVIDSSGPYTFVITLFRWDGSQWQREVGIVAPDITREGQAAHSTWGQSMSFSREAGWFAFGDPANVTAGAGVSHELIGEGPRHGAAYLFKRVESAGGHWNFLSLIKAPHPGAEDGFGETVAISGSGRTLAVGAVFEDSNARGVDGNQLDNSSPESGAAYLY